VLDQNGIRQHGTVASQQAEQPRPAYLPLTLARDGVSVKVAFLSFSWGTNGIPDPYNQVNLLWATNEYGAQGAIRPEVLDAIAQARRGSDLVVVAAHWGYEYQFYPDAAQIEGAARMAAAGADIILGAQAHTLQPVDILDTGGRKTLVIYSLANFLASQGAYQDEFFSATSVIFYAGFVRRSDGTVRVTGYRYLPIMHVDDDTRPAPIPADGYGGVIDHVRLEMRDFGGARQVGPDPAGVERVEVCPSYRFPAAPEARVGGDFAQYAATLGSGSTLRSPEETLSVVGLPLGPVVQEPSGDCRGSVSVLYTERQRLELHPEASWPFRVTGTQIGVEVYKQKYGQGDPPRRTNLDGDAIGDERFKRFFEAYGGLPAFGYPLSGLLNEADAAGQTQTVQYFERARFELIPGAPAEAPLLAQVRLGALGREYPGIAAQCGLPEPTAAPAATQLAAGGAPAIAAPPAVSPLVAEAEPGGRAWWIWALLALVVLGVGGAALWDTRRRRVAMERRLTRRRRFVEQGRRADGWVEHGVAARKSAAPAMLSTQRSKSDDDELLRRLLGN
jgi:hypothetical protein